MKCKQQNNIELFVKGELEGALLDDLKAHLENCKACQMYLNDLKEHEQKLVRIKRYNPVLPNPESFRNEVMQMITIESKSSPSRVFTPVWRATSELLDEVVDVLLMPVTRYAFIAAAMIIFGVFIYQQTTIMQKMDSLEKRIETSQHAGSLERGGRRSADSLIKRRPETISGDMEYNELLEDYRILLLKHKVLLKALQERYPDTYQDIIRELESADLQLDNLNI